jgi:7,8-dihydropterin-6-yl-methyl-4-(beta-D-ribofuranosyl)aminobenzene 5'-phosphate synthase
MRIKRIARPFPESDREEYLNAVRLDNRERTGFLPRLLAVEDEVFARTAAFLQKPRTPDELAAFQDEMAAKGLEALRSIRPAAAGPLRITVLYDNTAHRPGCDADWGFACLVEGARKTILFDTGTKADVFARNVGALRVDLSRVGALVVSHPHGDHTGGLPVALKARPGLPVYLPFGAPPALAEALRKEGATVLSPEGPADVAPDALVTGPVGGPVPEQALVLDTRDGLVVITGCSHPGIVAILEKVKQLGGGRLLAVLGGFHLLEHSDEAVAGIVARFRELGVERVGATHCTGEKAIEAFRKAYGARFVEMGAGRVVELP